MPQPGGRGHYFVYIGTQAILFGRAAYDTLQNQMKEILKETIVLDDGSDIPKYSCPDWKGNDPKLFTELPDSGAVITLAFAE